MGDETKHQAPRRFRFARRVKESLPETREAREMRQLEHPQDDADRGTPEQDRSLRQGCGGCLNVTLLLFVIMVASIIGTCAIRK